MIDATLCRVLSLRQKILLEGPTTDFDAIWAIGLHYEKGLNSLTRFPDTFCRCDIKSFVGKQSADPSTKICRATTDFEVIFQINRVSVFRPLENCPRACRIERLHLLALECPTPNLGYHDSWKTASWPKISCDMPKSSFHRSTFFWAFNKN